MDLEVQQTHPGVWQVVSYNPVTRVTTIHATYEGRDAYDHAYSFYSKARTALTRSGKLVVLNQPAPTEGGWFSFILDSKGYAVSVFVPGAGG
jgi:hypothetical protein